MAPSPPARTPASEAGPLPATPPVECSGHNPAPIVPRLGFSPPFGSWGRWGECQRRGRWWHNKCPKAWSSIWSRFLGAPPKHACPEPLRLLWGQTQGPPARTTGSACCSWCSAGRWCASASRSGLSPACRTASAMEDRGGVRHPAPAPSARHTRPRLLPGRRKHPTRLCRQF